MELTKGSSSPRLARLLKRPGCPWVCRPWAVAEGSARPFPEGRLPLTPGWLLSLHGYTETKNGGKTGKENPNLLLAASSRLGREWTALSQPLQAQGTLPGEKEEELETEREGKVRTTSRKQGSSWRLLLSSAVPPASTTSTHTCVCTHTQTLAREKGWSGFPSCRQERAHRLDSPRAVYPGESGPGTPATPGTHLPPGSTPTMTSQSRER